MSHMREVYCYCWVTVSRAVFNACNCSVARWNFPPNLTHIITDYLMQMQSTNSLKLKPLNRYQGHEKSINIPAVLQKATLTQNRARRVLLTSNENDKVATFTRAKYFSSWWVVTRLKTASPSSPSLRHESRYVTFHCAICVTGFGHVRGRSRDTAEGMRQHRDWHQTDRQHKVDNTLESARSVPSLTRNLSMNWPVATHGHTRAWTDCWSLTAAAAAAAAPCVRQFSDDGCRLSSVWRPRYAQSTL